MVGLYVPAMHKEQLLALLLLYCPEGHSWATPATQNEPAGQDCGTVVPAGQLRPLEHAEQLATDCAPMLLSKVPAGQRLQVLAPT